MKHIRWILTTLVFYALPLLMLCYGFGRMYDGLEKNSYDNAFDQLDKIILALRKQEVTQKHISRLIKQVCYKASASPDPHAILKRGIRNLQQRFPGLLRFYVVDKDGELSADISEPNVSRALFKGLYKGTYTGLVKKDHKTLESRWNMYKAFIGPDCNQDLYFSNNLEFIEVGSTEEKRRFFYFVNERLGVFVHANQPLNWDLLSLQDQMNRFQRLGRFPAIKVGLAPLGKRVEDETLDQAMTGFFKTGLANQISGDWLFRISGLETAAHLWAGIPATKVSDTRMPRLFVAMAVVFLFAILCLFHFSITLGKSVFFFSIRLRLMVLFFFASSLPLMVLFMAGWDYLQQKYEIEVRNAHDHLERALRGFDSRFPLLRFSMQKHLTRVLEDKRYETPHQQKRTRKALDYLARHWGSSGEYILYDDQGATVHYSCLSPASEKGTRGQQLMGGIIRSLIANLNQEPVKGKQDFGSGLMESMGGVKDPVSLFAKALNKIVDFSLAGNQSLTYMKPIRGHDNRVTHIVVAHWRKQELEKSFLESRLIFEERNSPGVNLLAISGNQSWRTPANYPYLRQVIPTLESVLIRQSTTTGRSVKGKHHLLITAIKPKEVANNYLFAVQNDEEIRNTIAILQKRLGFFALITGVMSLFLGLTLSQKFLTPVSDLSEGVKAIQEKMFDHRVPTREHDELGDLAKMFNNMIENLHEVSVASEVQARLFPSAVLQLGDYRVFGRSRPATQLGGDYFDYLVFGNRYLLVLIGDVTGHGVPAALIMAMSKALVLHCSNCGFEARKLVESLNLVIFQCAKKKLLMTSSFIWIDTQTHESTLINCGHPFPFHLKGPGNISMIEAAGSPLGMRAKLVATPAECPMEPGERVFLYTDGLVESLEVTDGRTHFEHFGDYLASRPLLPIEASCTDILDNHFHYTTGLPQPDDFTILIVERIIPEAPKA